MINSCYDGGQNCSEYYELCEVITTDIVMCEGHMRVQNDGNHKGYKAIAKVLLWD